MAPSTINCTKKYNLNKRHDFIKIDFYKLKLVYILQLFIIK